MPFPAPWRLAHTDMKLQYNSSNSSSSNSNSSNFLFLHHNPSFLPPDSPICASSSSSAPSSSTSSSSSSSSPSPASPLMIPTLHMLKQQQQQQQQQQQHHQALLAMNNPPQHQHHHHHHPISFNGSSLPPYNRAPHYPQHCLPSPSPSCNSSSSSSPSPLDQYASLLSLKIQAQRNAFAHNLSARALKQRNSPLSPQESSSTNTNSNANTNSSTNTAIREGAPFSELTPSAAFLRGTVEPNRLAQREPCVQSHPPSDSSPSPKAPWMLHRDLHFSDLPIVRGPSAFQGASPAPGPSPSPSRAAPPAFAGSPLHSPSITHQQRCAPHRMDSDGRASEDYKHRMESDGRTIEDSKRLKLTLEDLERELLGDEPDVAASCVANTGMAFAPAPKPPESDWADVIEDFVSAESSSLPAQTAEQSTITCTSSRMDEATAPTVNMPQPDASAQLRNLLLSCANAIDESDLSSATAKIACLEHLVSTYGDPMQRLAAYMVDGLMARVESLKGGSINGGYMRALQKFKDISPLEVMRATQSLYNFCPYFKFGYMAANAVIAEAFRNEPRIHIIDFEIRHGNQWQALIRACSQRPGGPPHVRLTGIADPKSPTSLEGVGRRLEEIAQQAGLPFEFKPLQMEACQVKPWMLGRRAEDALAVNFAFQLHHMPDESVCMTNPRDTLLRMVRSMEPKVVTISELEANTNTSPFYPRFMEVLRFFGAVFESLDDPLPRDSKLRVNAEQHCLARQIVNIIACEDGDRTERYELAGKWRARMGMAGFKLLPMSPFISRTTKEILQPYSPNYKMREESGALHLDWLDKGLVVASAWH